MSNKITHPYHIVDESPWPIYGSLAGIFFTTGILSWFHTKRLFIFFLGIVRLILVIYQWWRDISREGALQGLHTRIVELGLRSGILLFITSEVFFFLRFFWAYFHARLSPNVEWVVWLYSGILPFNLLGVFLLNTLVLLSFGGWE